MSRPEDDPEAARERLRLYEFQLDYLRAELLHLTHERYRMIYSASWLIYRPLRAFEARLVDAATALWRRLGSVAGAAAPVIPAAGAAAPAAAIPARRLLIDVTGTIKRDAGTGIQRVVKKVVQAFHGGESFALPVLAVRCENGRLLTANEFVASLDCPAPAGVDAEVAIAPGDRFFMLSDSWNAFEELAPVLARIRAEGGEIVSCVFDLIPALYPHACHEVTVPRYDAWLRKALIESDAFLAISRTVAEELADFVETRALPQRPGLKIGWFHCGSDIGAGAGEPREAIRAAAAGDAPLFLCVGTFEPRKGQRVVLRAFDELWRDGVDASLIFVGRRGWFEEAVAAEIAGHAEFGRRLHWFEDAGDAELTYLYDRAVALLLASYAEGFGLPIVEAARRGKPALCSDIPVFREVGGEGAAYFRLNDPAALADCLRRFLAGEIAPDPSKALRSTWADAAHRIAHVIAREDWLRRLG
jgi:alpha-1,2-rhamnosyltransferase